MTKRREELLVLRQLLAAADQRPIMLSDGQWQSWICRKPGASTIWKLAQD